MSIFKSAQNSASHVLVWCIKKKKIYIYIYIYIYISTEDDLHSLRHVIILCNH